MVRSDLRIDLSSVYHQSDQGIYYDLLNEFQYVKNHQQMNLFHHLKKATVNILPAQNTSLLPPPPLSPVQVFQTRPDIKLDHIFESDYSPDHSIKYNRDIIIVTSLLDNVPNIAGICRTAEIFGLQRIMVRNRGLTKETAFKKQSVTSENLLDIEELAVNKVGRFLEEKKKEGYEIVGIEQSERSYKLGERPLGRKTVLLVGNEQMGIPADLLQQLDLVLEIEQYGRIQSLNAHVAVSLVLYEYRKHLT